MASVKWVKELPPTKNQRGNWLDVTVLDARPGVWAILRTYKEAQTAHPTATRLRQRHTGYEFAVRKNGSGGVLYGRKRETVG